MIRTSLSRESQRGSKRRRIADARGSALLPEASGRIACLLSWSALQLTARTPRVHAIAAVPSTLSDVPVCHGHAKWGAGRGEQTLQVIVRRVYEATGLWIVQSLGPLDQSLRLEAQFVSESDALHWRYRWRPKGYRELHLLHTSEMLMSSKTSTGTRSRLTCAC